MTDPRSPGVVQRSACGNLDRKSRKDQATCRGTQCGFAEHAGSNAARNIASRADWATVERPDADAIAWNAGTGPQAGVFDVPGLPPRAACVPFWGYTVSPRASMATKPAIRLARVSARLAVPMR